MTACKSTKRTTPPAPPPRVQVAQVRSGPLAVTYGFHAEVRPLRQAQLAAGAAGQVLHVTVREGDAVRRGQRLLGIDAATAKAELLATEAEQQALTAQLAQARRDVDRLSRVGRGAVALAEIEQAEARVRTLEAQQEGRRAQAAAERARLKLHRVQAPFAGVVAARFVDPGDFVEAADPVLEVVTPDALDVLTQVTPKVWRALQVGTTATLVAAEGQCKARVRARVPLIDKATRTLKVRLEPADPPLWLLAGGAVQARFVVDEGSGSHRVVPRDALRQTADKTQVVRVRRGQAQVLFVRLLQTAGTHALLQAPALRPGDPVVVRGNEGLRDGQQVRILRSP
ncbi:MAG: efflux RND transporter periplasmic adaptor subunit [Polyangiales bacterium]